MRIDSSNIGMESRRSYFSNRADAYSYNAWNKNGQTLQLNVGLFSQTEENTEDKRYHSDEKPKNSFDQIKEKYEQMKTSSRNNFKTKKTEIPEIEAECIDFLLAILLNHKFYKDNNELNLSQSCASDSGVSSGSGSGSTYSEIHFYEENETTSFSTVGTVKTADGRELSFNLEAEMSREFMEYTELNISSGTQFCDPLVINLDGNVASVSDKKFMFDIDGDGSKENISELNKGSGYLALDLNQDGVINDGSELFGTSSGDGFQDLSKYDSDGNGWIDENDKIFDKLMIWTKDEAGEDVLYHLKDKNVGAMYLGNKDTQFSLNSAKNNEINAMIRKTGVFLYENGSAGTMQQLDLAKTYN